MKKMPREQLVLKAVLLLRTINRYSSKEDQIIFMDKHYSTEQLEDYVEHFGEPQPETIFEEPDNGDSRNITHHHVHAVTTALVIRGAPQE